MNDGSLSKTSVADAAGQRTQMASLINACLRPAHDAAAGGPLRPVADRRHSGRSSSTRWSACSPWPTAVVITGSTAPTGSCLSCAMGGILFFGVIAGDRRRRRALTPAPGRPRVHPRGQGSRPAPGVRRLPRPRATHRPVEQPGVLVVRSRRAALLRQRGSLPRPDPSAHRGRAAASRGAGNRRRGGLADGHGWGRHPRQTRHGVRPRGISIALARVQSNVSDVWRRAGTLAAIGGEDRVFDTVREAVDGIVAGTVRVES